MESAESMETENSEAQELPTSEIIIDDILDFVFIIRHLFSFTHLFRNFCFTYIIYSILTFRKPIKAQFQIPEV